MSKLKMLILHKLAERYVTLMIINRLHRIKASVVSCLLMAFAMVFVCGILCDTGVIDIQMYASHRSSHDHDQFDHDHFWMVSPSYGEDDHGDDEYDKTNQTTHHQHEKTDDCCEEAREEWLATIVQQESPEFQIVKIPVLLLDVKLPDSFVIISEIVERRYEFRCALSPPGSQIRILLQSFLC